MKPLEEARQAVEKLREEMHRLTERSQVAQQAHRRALEELAAADVDSPDFGRIVAKVAVECARVDVLGPRVRLARHRWEEAQQRLGQLEQRAAMPPPPPPQPRWGAAWEP
jgi:hypothetical protein